VGERELEWVRSASAVYVGYARDFRTKARRID
jgi:hypothetical protein